MLSPDSIVEAWEQWKTELPLLTNRPIQRCHFPKGVEITSLELHRFSDASEKAYAGVEYLRALDSKNCIHISLVIMAKSKVHSNAFPYEGLNYVVRFCFP